MPPWPEWQFEYMGSRFLGRLLGLWSTLWVSIVRMLFRLLTKTARNRRDSSNDTRPSGTDFSFARKFSKMSASTLLTVAVWRIVTLKAVWVAAGESGDRILTAILLFVSASWVISLIWICFSQSKRQTMPRTAHRVPEPRYTSSTSTKAS